MLSECAAEAVDLITTEYRRNDTPWYLGFSGGKDSSAVLKLTFQALTKVRRPIKPVSVIYCDTGVEIPIVRALVLRTFRRLSQESRAAGLPLRFNAVSPRLEDRFFVKVIGRGYATPTNKFRWCTDRLRIKPIERVLACGEHAERVVLLGVRRGESAERDRTISRHTLAGQIYLRQAGRPNTLILSPILDFDTEDVWDTLLHPFPPRGIDAHALATLYRKASGECPIIRDPRGTPCGKGRFGCWTCTVVRHDRAVENLVEAEGFEQLRPLLAFRNWLSEIRDDPAYRARYRRNGIRGLGPFTLGARKTILTRLLRTQARTPWQLISRDEVRAIRNLWKIDVSCGQYRE